MLLIHSEPLSKPAAAEQVKNPPKNNSAVWRPLRFVAVVCSNLDYADQEWFGASACSNDPKRALKDQSPAAALWGMYGSRRLVCSSKAS